MKVAFESFDPWPLFAIANSKPVPGNSEYESLKHMLRLELKQKNCLVYDIQMLHDAVIEVIGTASDLIVQGRSTDILMSIIHQRIKYPTFIVSFCFLSEKKDVTSGKDTQHLVSQLDRIHLSGRKRTVLSQPELTYDILLPRLSDYLPPKGKPSIDILLRILQDPKPGRRDVLLHQIKELCSYGTRFCPETKQIVEDRERRPLLQELTEASHGIITEAIQIGLNYSTTVPFQLSVVIISTSLSRGRDSYESWKELKDICVLLIMLASVRNVVFVPTTFTEGNTVLVTPSAHRSCDLRTRDMNIILKGKQDIFQLNHGMLKDILCGIQKKSTVYV